MVDIATALQDLKEPQKSDIKFKKSVSSEEKIQEQKMNYFKLLATELQHQDPTNPIDTNQMTAQALTLSSLEQQLESNKLLSQMVSMMKTNDIFQAASQIGTHVFHEGDNLEIQNEEGIIKYKIDSLIRNPQLEILDATTLSPIFKTTNLERTPGVHTFNVNKSVIKDIKDGLYKISVRGDGVLGDIVKAKTFVSGKIDGVVNDGSSYQFSVNGRAIDSSKIIEVGRKSDSPFSQSITDQLSSEVSKKIKDLAA